MRKKSVNTLLVFGVVVAIILLMIWLFLGTTLVEDTSTEISRKHSKKCTFYTLRFGCSFAAVNTIKPQLL